MDKKTTDEELSRWRTSVINIILLIGVVAATIGTIMSILDALRRPDQWPAVIVFASVLPIFLFFAVFRRIDFRIRTWVFLATAYLISLTVLFSLGLGGSGRIYLVVLPIIALILLGQRSGILMAVTSVVTLVAFSLLSRYTNILQTSVTERNSLSVSDWLAESSDTVILLVIVMVILVLFYRFQKLTIVKEQDSKTELIITQELLEQQKANLEEEIANRTKEIQKSNENLEQRNSELTLLNNLSQALTKTLDVRTVTRVAGDNLREIFDSDGVAIMLIDPQTRMIYSYYEYDKNEGGMIDSLEPFPIGTGLTSKVILSGQPLLLNTLEEEIANGAYFPPELVEGGSGTLTQSWLGVPIIAGDETRGIVFISDYDAYAFDENHLKLLQTLSSTISVAIENARLYTDVTNRVDDLAAINSVSSTVVGELDLNSLIKLVGEQIRTTFNADVAYVALLDEGAGLIRFPYAYGEGDTPIEFGEGLTSQILKTGQPLLINENIEGRILENQEAIIGTPSLSYIGVPVIVRGKAVGVISVQSTHKEGIFDENDLSLLNTIAAYVGPAVQNARLFNRLQSEKKFSETLITTSPVAIATLDKNNLVNTWNPAAEKLYGYSREEAVGQFIVDLVSDEHSRQEALGISALISSGKSVHSIVQRRDKDGGRLDLEMFAVPVVFEGRRIGTFVMYHDITELKRAEDAILESERRLADIIDFLPDATMVIDREGKVIAWNRAIEEMTGVKSDEMVGKGNYEYAIPFYGERRPILIDLVLMPREEFERGNYVKIDRVGELLTGETFTPSLAQGSRYLFATATLLHDAKGNIVGAAETIRDITDRKLAEEELRKAKESADAANKAKSAFLANMSHELRTPLNAIIGFTRIVRRKGEDLLPEKQIENLDKVLVSAEHLLGLINTTLDIAKIEAGRMDVLAANFRIASLIDQCVNTSVPLVKDGVILGKQVDEDLNLVYSDQDKIRQIVLNLLSNAAKFTQQGRILLSARKEGMNDLCIDVVDTGIGISEEALPRIFKEFQQADSSTTRQYGGTGLGLAISRSLARLLGGDLTVVTELGKGSTFTLKIPLHYNSNAAVEQEAEGTSGMVAEPNTLSDNSRKSTTADRLKRVLVVDSDPDSIYLLQDSLGEGEFEIISTRNGRDSLQLAKEIKPQAILLDVLMPDVDGWQILNSLKEDAETSNIPVILLTIVDKKALGFSLGASAYLLKPLDPAAVKKVLDKLIIRKDRTRKHVLVVDDDPNVADLLRQYLPEAEFLVQSAKDGNEGLEAVRTRQPDILLLDLIMPGLDGFVVIEKLRADPVTRNLPVIVISAKELTRDETKKLKHSVSLILRKQGFEGDRLVDEINSVLTGDR